VAAILDRLDAAASPPDAVSQRESERYDYRVHTLVVECEGPTRERCRYVARPRNISRDGISFVISNFVYPGSRCRIRLVTEYNHPQIIRGTVTRCRYLQGTGGIHEVGVRFERAINVALFHRAALSTRVLAADGDELQRRVAERLLKPLSVDLTCVENGEDAVAQATEQLYDLVLLAADLPGLDGLAATRELRSRGYSRPIAVVTDSSDPEERDRALEAGCTACTCKPLTREGFEQLLSSIRGEPLISSLIQDVEMGDLIDSFVADLSSRIGELESTFAKEDYEALDRMCRLIKGQAGACGFETIAERASEVGKSLGAKEQASAIRDRLNELIRLCLAARPAGC